MAKCKVGFGALGLNPDDATGFRLGRVAAGGGSLSCLRDGPRGTHPRDAKVKEHGARGAEVFLSTKSGFVASRLLFAVPCRTHANDAARGPSDVSPVRRTPRLKRLQGVWSGRAGQRERGGLLPPGTRL